MKIIHAKEKGYDIHIDKSDFSLDLFVAGIFAKRYVIGHGAVETPTPTGTTFIDAREREPTWYEPSSNAEIPYGDPRHIIGPVWMRFNADALGQSGLGIHGYTGEGAATQVKASNGCIRMANEDARELYNILVPCGMYSSGFMSRAPMRVTIVD